MSWVFGEKPEPNNFGLNFVEFFVGSKLTFEPEIEIHSL